MAHAEGDGSDKPLLGEREAQDGSSRSIPRMEGWLYKTDPELTKYQRRYFVCDDNYLSYYKFKPTAGKSVAPKGSLRLAQASSVSRCEPPAPKGGFGRTKSPPSAFGFCLRVPGRPYFFACETEASQSQWVSAVQATVRTTRARAASVVSTFAAPDDTALNSVNPDGEPNCLRVVVVQGKGLLAKDKGGTSDAFVELWVDSSSKVKTKTIPKTVDPVWKEGFEFDVAAETSILHLAIFDADMGGLSRDSMGVLDVPMDGLRGPQAVKKWFSVVDKKEGQRGRNGEILLKLHWVHSIEVASRKPSKKGRKVSVADEGLQEFGTQGEDDEIIADDDVDIDALLAEKEANEKQRAEKLSRLEGVEVKKGDYQIQVHIIEVRDLKPEDLDGTSDPVVYIETFGQKQHTKVKKDCVSAVFDDVFFFSAKDVDVERLEVETIKVSVFDADTFTRNDLIGSFMFDVLDTYYRDDHELFEQWVGLTDEKNPSDSGIQGYLKLSIAVLGPGDKKKVRSESSSGSGPIGDLSSMVMMPPQVKQEMNFLVVSVLRAEDLPVMDNNILTSSGIDAYIQAEFGGNPPLKTRAVTCKGTKHLNPVFNEEFWLPVVVPTMTNSIAISVRDKDLMGKDEVVGTAHFKFPEVQRASTASQLKVALTKGKKLSKSQIRMLHEGLVNTIKLQERAGDEFTTTTLRWVNVYGAPVNIPMSLPGKVPSSDVSKRRNEMNSFPGHASHYKGRFLVSLRVSRDPSNKEPEHNHKKAIPFSRANLIPLQRRYNLWAYIITGADFPSTSGVSIGGPTRYSIRVSIGSHVLSTERIAPTRGMYEFLTPLRLEDIPLPADPRDLPDIFIHLISGKKEKGRPICYYRINTREWFKDAYPVAFRESCQKVSAPSLQELLANADNRGLGGGVRKAGQAIKGLFGSKSATSAPEEKMKPEVDAESNDVSEAMDSVAEAEGEEAKGGETSAKSAAVLRRAFVKSSSKHAATAKKMTDTVHAAQRMEEKIRSGGFSQKAQWISLVRDPVVDGISRETFPGSLLVKLGFGPNTSTPPMGWAEEVENKVANVMRTIIRVRVYQGRNLPAADSNGMSDPYVIVRCCGQTKRTSWKPCTVDPLWYETIDFDIEAPKDLHFAPQLVLQVMDHDVLGSADLLGTTRLQLKHAFSLPGGPWGSPTCRATSLPDPRWRGITVESDGVVEGEILVSVESFRVPKHVAMIPPCPSIVPDKRQAYVDVIALGLRDLKANGLVPLTAPFVEFDIGERGKKSAQHKTAPSKKPAPANPNFLERVMFPVMLPKNTLFTPRLNLRVFDSKLGGFSKRSLAQVSIPIDRKIPWSPQYIPPCTQSFPESGMHIDKSVETNGTPDGLDYASDSSVENGLGDSDSDREANEAEKAAAFVEGDMGAPMLSTAVSVSRTMNDAPSSPEKSPSSRPKVPHNSIGDLDLNIDAVGSDAFGTSSDASQRPRSTSSFPRSADAASNMKVPPQRTRAASTASHGRPGGLGVVSERDESSSGDEHFGKPSSSPTRTRKPPLGAGAGAGVVVGAGGRIEEDEDVRVVEKPESDESEEESSLTASPHDRTVFHVVSDEESKRAYAGRRAIRGETFAEAQLREETGEALEHSHPDLQLEALGLRSQSSADLMSQRALNRQVRDDEMRRLREDDEMLARWRNTRADRASSARSSGSKRSSRTQHSRRSQSDVSGRRLGQKSVGRFSDKRKKAIERRRQLRERARDLRSRGKERGGVAAQELRERMKSKKGDGEGDDGVGDGGVVDEVEALEHQRRMDTGVHEDDSELDDADLSDVLDEKEKEIEARGLRMKAPLEALAAESSSDEDDIPEWLMGRAEHDVELEDVLETQPFETYPVFRGQRRGKTDLFGKNKSTYREVGRFKGIIRVVEQRDAPPPIDIDVVLRPDTYTVRVYVTQGHSLMPMDDNGKSDPFLIVKLGNKKINDVKNHIKETIDPKFYRMFEVTAELPGPSQLHLNCFDYDMLTANDLIGTTVIDLEDRLFDQRWKALGKAHRSETRYEPKPIERRALWQPTSTNPQGLLDMWVDIMEPDDAKKYPAVDISLPPPQAYEVRVVIWKAKDVVSADVVTDQNDLYIKCWLENTTPQCTDVHWRAKKGKGSFNWRMKWDVELPYKFPYFHIQMWDKDLLKFSDCIAEAAVDLAPVFELALKSGKSVNVFSKKDAKRRAKEKLARKAERKEKRRRRAEEERSRQDAEALGTAGKHVDAGPTAAAMDGGREGDVDGGEEVKGLACEPDAAPDSLSTDTVDDGAERKGSDVEVSLADGASQSNEGHGHVPEPKPSEGGPAGGSAKQGASDAAPGLVSGSSVLPETAEEDESPVLEAHAARSIDDAGGAKTGAEVEAERAAAKAEQLKQRKEAEKRQEASSFANQILDMVGMGPIPEDAQWLKMKRKNWDTGEMEDMGSVLVTIEVLPKEDAEGRPAGLGREEPNTNPFLPPPTGRLKLTAMWNPFYVLNEMLGPRLCSQITMVLFILGFVALGIVAGPQLASGLTTIDFIVRFIQSIPSPANWLVPTIVIGMLASCVALCCWKIPMCRKCCSASCWGFCCRNCCPCCSCCIPSRPEDDGYEEVPVADSDLEAGAGAGAGAGKLA